MFLFELSTDASKFISAYVKVLRDSVNQRFSIEIDEKGWGIFVSEVMDDIKFLAIKVSEERGANSVELQDVQKASKKLFSGFLYNAEVFYRFYKKTLHDVSVLKERAKRVGALWVLDAGCGWGRASRRVSKYLDRETEFVGIDLDPYSLKYGKCVNRNFSFVRAHMSHSPFKSSVFDVVISSKSLHEFRDKSNSDTVFIEFCKILGSNGVLWIFDVFERCYLTKIVRRLMQKLPLKVEPYFELAELERKLQGTNFMVMRRTCTVMSLFSLRKLCSYIVIKS